MNQRDGYKVKYFPEPEWVQILDALRDDERQVALLHSLKGLHRACVQYSQKLSGISGDDLYDAAEPIFEGKMFKLTLPELSCEKRVKGWLGTMAVFSIKQAWRGMRKRNDLFKKRGNEFFQIREDLNDNEKRFVRNEVMAFLTECLEDLSPERSSVVIAFLKSDGDLSNAIGVAKKTRPNFLKTFREARELLRRCVRQKLEQAYE